MAGEAKSYAERLLQFPRIGELSEAEACAAVVDPAKELGVNYEDEAIRAIIQDTEGYPYFLQEYGKIPWDLTNGPTITVTDVQAARATIKAELDSSFFRVRTDRVTKLELQYMRAMAELVLTPSPPRMWRAF